MTREQLYNKLTTLKAYKNERLQLGNAAIHYELIPDLITYCYPDSGVSHQACWALEQSFLEQEIACYPYLEQLCALFIMPINSSGMRGLTKIGSILARKYHGKKPQAIKELLTLEMRNHLLEGCFQELLVNSHCTANIAYSSRCIYDLGKDIDWAHDALAQQIEILLQQRPDSGFRVVGTDLLKKMRTH